MELKKEYFKVTEEAKLKAVAPPSSSQEETNGEETSLEVTNEKSAPEATVPVDLTLEWSDLFNHVKKITVKS